MQYITWNPPILSNPKSLQIKYKLNNARTASNLKSYSISKSSNKSVKMYLGASLVAQWQRIRLPVQETGSIPGLKDPLEKEMVTHSSILAWEIP